MRQVQAGRRRRSAANPPGAITAFYGRFGFLRAGLRGLRNEWGLDDPFIALERQDGAVLDAGGLVKYAPQFSTVT